MTGIAPKSKKRSSTSSKIVKEAKATKPVAKLPTIPESKRKFLHLPNDCTSRFCPIHNPTDHGMRSFRIVVDAANIYRGLSRTEIYRACDHKQLHLDPDEFWRVLYSVQQDYTGYKVPYKAYDVYESFIASSRHYCACRCCAPHYAPVLRKVKKELGLK